MHKTVIAPDRVLLLLSLVAYLREQDAPVAVSHLADRFGVPEKLIRSLVSFLGTAGVPGETMSYQHEDLFDIDWDLLETADEVWLSRTVAVDEAPRFAPTETAALLAGLNALIPVLQEEDAEVARGAAAKLADALGGDATPAVSAAAERQDPRIPALMSALERGAAVGFSYRDAAGRASSRRARPIAVNQGEGAWYLRAFCLDRRAERTFRVEHMSELHELDSEESGEGPRDTKLAPSSGAEPMPALIATIPADALDRLRAFSPEPIGEAADGRLRVRVEAWHPAAAVQLVQAAPALVEIEEPAAARKAVREWAERGLAAYGE